MTRPEKIAQIIYDIDPYGARDADATPETIAHDIENDPLSVIEWLIDEIIELQA